MTTSDQSLLKLFNYHLQWLSNKCASIYVKHNNWGLKSVFNNVKKNSVLYCMKITMNRMKVRPSCLRCLTATSFNENDIWQSYKTRMYEKKINLTDVSFIFLRKKLPGNVFNWVPKCSKSITVGDGGGSHVPGYFCPGFLDCWAASPHVKNSKMITEQAQLFMCLQFKSFENTEEKGEIARNELFLLVFYAFGKLSAIFIKFGIVFFHFFFWFERV